MEEEALCSCGSDSPTCDGHLLDCDLWADDDWAYGLAEWDFYSQSLVWPMKGSSSSLFTAIDDEIGGQICDQAQLPLETKTLAVEFEDICLQLEEVLLADWPEPDEEPGNYTLDGVSRIWNPEWGTWQTKQLRCWCPIEGDGTGRRICSVCKVWRPGRQNDGTLKSPTDLQWRASTIRKDELVCRCYPPRLFECKKCGVRRSKVDEPFKWQAPTEGGAITYTSSGNWSTNWSKLCRHQGRELKLPNGDLIYGSSASAKDNPEFEPDFGVYLDKAWTPRTLALYIPWTDMGLPELKFDHIQAAVTLITSMAEKGQKVELGCIGGHGRTGTLMALVVMNAGLNLSGTTLEIAERAAKYVRDNYCDQAIETATQEWYIEAYYCKDHDLPLPEEPVESYSTGASSVQSGAAAGLVCRKRNDNNGVWYCHHCFRDCKTDYEEWCHWCHGIFNNGGARPIEDWNEGWVKDNPTGAMMKVSTALIKMQTDPQGPVPNNKPVEDVSNNRERFFYEGRSYKKSDQFCVKCKTQLYFKIRWQKAGTNLPYRSELVHAGSLRKLRRCKGGLYGGYE